ncbi:MAG: MarR family transcriptional regulator [Actinomycetota bacterium]
MATGIDEILAQWTRERPDLDVSPMAVIGRLTRAAAVIDVRLARTFATYGLDAASFDVLATLLRSGDPYALAPKDLADAAMVTSSAIAQRVNKLASAGLVIRHKSSADGRGTLVTLTSKGKNLAEKVLPHHLETEHSALQSLTKHERAKMADLLQSLYDDNIDKVAAVPEPPG